MMSSKKTSIALKRKLEILEEIERNEHTKRIKSKFDVSKQILSNLKKQKDLIKEAGKNINGEMKKLRKSKYENINKFVLDLLDRSNQNFIPISAAFIQSSALKFAEHIGEKNFKASNGWLQKLKKKYNIKHVMISGESASADQDGANNFVNHIEEITEGYQDDEIFNLDETGLFWRALPDKTLTTNKNRIKGRKLQKERLTILFLVNKLGEKKEAVIIGKIKNPRALKGKKNEHLGIKYTVNKNAWVTKPFFQEYLFQINQQLQLSNKKILLFLDNCSSHVPQDFSNIKLQFLPPNTTSLIQPLDQGIIHSFKSNYRKYLMNFILSDIDGNFNQKIKSYNIFDAIQNISLAWKNVSVQTIQNCFRPLFKSQIDIELQTRFFEEKIELEVLINTMENLKIVYEKMDYMEYFEMDCKQIITTKDCAQELLSSTIKDYSKNFNRGLPKSKKADAKKLKDLLVKIKKQNDIVAPELSLHLIEYENLLNQYLNKTRDQNKTL